MTALIGHTAAWESWRSARDGARMHHAWLLHGPQGLGKASFALAAARDLVGSGGEGMHPDIITLTRGPANETEAERQADGKPFATKRNISIDQVRSMLRRLNTRPTLGDARAIIIDCADDLERSAANALLKALEEPPQGTMFLLVSHRPGRLLPTIRSRCRQLAFSLPTAAELASVLANHAPEAGDDALVLASKWGGGTPGGALAILDNGLIEPVRIMAGLAQATVKSPSQAGGLSEAMGSKPGREAMESLLAAACRIAAAGAATREHASAAIASHQALVRLQLAFPTANYDNGALIVQIGNLLASVAAPKAKA